MVFVDPKNLGYTPYYEKWLNTRSDPDEMEHLATMFERYVHPVLKMVIEGVVGIEEGPPLKLVLYQTALNMVRRSDPAMCRYKYFHSLKQQAAIIYCCLEKIDDCLWKAQGVGA